MPDDTTVMIDRPTWERLNELRETTGVSAKGILRALIMTTTSRLVVEAMLRHTGGDNAGA